jgi:Listeria-Bacteroides repeat domain (List_Bact_rpt).
MGEVLRLRTYGDLFNRIFNENDGFHVIIHNYNNMVNDLINVNDINNFYNMISTQYRNIFSITNIFPAEFVSDDNNTIHNNFQNFIQQINNLILNKDNEREFQSLVNRICLAQGLEYNQENLNIFTQLVNSDNYEIPIIQSPYIRNMFRIEEIQSNLPINDSLTNNIEILNLVLNALSSSPDNTKFLLKLFAGLIDFGLTEGSSTVHFELSSNVNSYSKSFKRLTKKEKRNLFDSTDNNFPDGDAVWLDDGYVDLKSQSAEGYNGFKTYKEFIDVQDFINWENKKFVSYAPLIPLVHNIEPFYFKFIDYITTRINMGYTATPFLYTETYRDIEIIGYNSLSILPSELNFPDYINGKAVTKISGNFSTNLSENIKNSIESIYIPATVTEVGEGAFRELVNLETIFVSEDNFNLRAIDNILYCLYSENDNFSWTLIQNPIKNEITQFVISSSIRTIIDDAVQDIDVRKIGAYSFNLCNISSLSLSSNIVSIEAYAFQNSNLSSISLPYYLTSIGEQAFYNCDNLTEISIGMYCKKTGAFAFGSCDSLSTISVNSYNSSYSASSGVLYDKSKSLLIQYPARKTNGSFTIPSTVKNIDDSAFEGNMYIQHLTLPAGLEKIGADAFANCVSLSEIIIPDNVTEIGAGVFSNCTGLTTVNLPSGLKVITDNLFYQCTSLNSISLPSGITDISNYAFHGCVNLSEIILPSGLDTIGAYAFYSCTGLAQIEMPDKITIVGANAFDGCANLHYASFRNIYPPYIQYRAFYDNAADFKIYVPEASVDLYIDRSLSSYADKFAVKQVAVCLKDGDEEINITIGYYSIQYILPAPPTKDNYAFKGWYDENGKGYYSNGLWDKYEGSILYARWRPISYVIYYHTERMSESTFYLNPDEYDYLDYTVESTQALYPATKKGYELEGWYRVDDDTRIDVLPVGSNYGNLHLYPKWTPKTYVIFLDENPDDETNELVEVNVVYNTAISGLYTPVQRDGYTFVGWKKENNYYYSNGDIMLNDGDLLLTADWGSNVYLVRFDLQGGSGKSDILAKYDFEMPSLPIPQKIGYTFVGYFTEPFGGGIQYYNPSEDYLSIISAKKYDIAGDLNLFAYWIPKIYTVTLKDSDADIGTIYAAYNSDMPSTEIPTKKGYKFTGYYYTRSDGRIFYYSPEAISLRKWNIAENSVLYATWENLTIKIIYHLNNGTNSVNNPNSYIYSESEDQYFILSNPERTNYNFAGWYYDPEFIGEAVSYLDLKAGVNDKDIELYANWIGKQIKINIAGLSLTTIDFEDPDYFNEFIDLSELNISGIESGIYNLLGFSRDNILYIKYINEYNPLKIITY